jgi:hypothetical protein
MCFRNLFRALFVLTSTASLITLLSIFIGGIIGFISTQSAIVRMISAHPSVAKANAVKFNMISYTANQQL